MRESPHSPEARLSRSVLHGISWSALESIGSAGVGFVVSVVMARFLTPAQFGLVAMMQVFIALAQVCAEGGIAQALVRRPSRPPGEDSTAFYLNLTAGLIIYIILYVSAPVVARFYAQPELTTLMRVIGIAVPLNALCVVQVARLTVAMDFKRLFMVSGVAVVVSGIVGILLAWAGAGVWALIWQQILMWGLRVVLLWMLGRWRPTLAFSFPAAGRILRFSLPLVGAGLLDTLWGQLYSLVIGKWFTPRSTGLFWRAHSLSQLPAQVSTSVIVKVAYPLLSGMSGIPSRIGVLFYRLLGMSCWLLFPLFALMAALGSQLFALLFPPEWQAAVPYFRWLCLVGIFYPVHSLNLTILNVAGRSDLFLRLEILKKLLVVLILMVTVPLGIEAICVGILAGSLLSLPLNLYFTRRFSGISVWQQVLLLLPLLLFSAVSAAGAYFTASLVAAPLPAFLAGLIAGVGIYMALTFVAKLPWPARLRAHKI